MYAYKGQGLYKRFDDNCSSVLYKGAAKSAPGLAVVRQDVAAAQPGLCRTEKMHPIAAT